MERRVPVSILARERRTSLSDAVGTFLAIESADDRSQTIGEAHVHDEHQGIDVVDKSSRSQFFRAAGELLSWWCRQNLT